MKMDGGMSQSQPNKISENLKIAKEGFQMRRVFYDELHHSGCGILREISLSILNKFMIGIMPYSSLTGWQSFLI